MSTPVDFIESRKWDKENLERSLSLNPWQTTAKFSLLKIASYLTEPLCKVREYYFSLHILDKTCQNIAQKVTQAAFFILGMIFFTLLAPFTTPIGALIRLVIKVMSKKPFIYLEYAKKGKTLPLNREITLVSHNQCYVPAGYSITDGGVTPSSDKNRMDANIEMLQKIDPDIICLYEVGDICDAEYISSKLSKYPFIIPASGISPTGPSSMMYVASKYKILKDSIEFLPFEKNKEITGRAKYSEKGVLIFDILSGDEKSPIATLVSTHLQHSEIPEEPDKQDISSRSKQMIKIANLIKEKLGMKRSVIFIGDLNLEEKELEAFFEKHQIDWLKRDHQIKGIPTWGGDEWCAKLSSRPISKPLVLDYCLVTGNTEVSTNIIQTNYASAEFTREATSDHYLLMSKIKLQA